MTVYIDPERDQFEGFKQLPRDRPLMMLNCLRFRERADYEDERWDLLFIARYPSAAAFLEMVTDSAYREAVKHRTAAVLDSRLIRCRSDDVGDGFAGQVSDRPR